MGMSTSHGRRMTQVARRCQAPSPKGFGCRMGMRTALTRRPSSASAAGSSVVAYSTEMATTIAPATPIDTSGVPV